jgi:hypothetical protein
MLFKFPQKKIILDCFTSDSYVVEYSPINFAIKHIPEWWKKLPTPEFDVTKNPMYKQNMKHCVGMIDYYKNSIAIPLWSDLAIGTNGDNQFIWKFSDGKTRIEQHNLITEATGFFNDYTHIKIMSPWFFKSEKDINWIWSHPTYNYSNENNFVYLPGIVSFYYQHSVNINMMFYAAPFKKIMISQGQPLALLTPMSDRKVEIINHLVSAEEMNKLKQKQIPITFLNKYKNVVKRKNQFIGCPYKGQ